MTKLFSCIMDSVYPAPLKLSVVGDYWYERKILNFLFQSYITTLLDILKHNVMSQGRKGGCLVAVVVNNQDVITKHCQQ